MGTAQMSISEWVDKQILVSTCNGMLFGHEKEWSRDAYHDGDEPWGHYAKWEKPGTRCHELSDCI